MSSRGKVMGVGFQQFVHGGPGEPDEICYLYHLDPPYKHAGHYLGTTELGVEERDKYHSAGIGARLLEVQKEHGGAWHLVRTWEGGRLKERALKMQSGKRYCPECTEHPRAGDELPNPAKFIYLTRKERAALKAEEEAAERARQKKQPGVEVVDARVVAFEKPKPYERTPEAEQRVLEAVTELEALWTRQAKEKEMKNLEAEARREGGEAGEREVLEAIERGMDPEAAMTRHEEIAGWLDSDAETPPDRAFAGAFWNGGRYAAEVVRGEQERREDMFTEPREPADLEIGA
jgi:hypothetical protein